jgi:F-type H+-transporting ATPase subunit epsilon
MADKLSFELVSPERLLMSAQVDMVVVPGGDGDFGVLPGHAPVISTVRPGVLEVYAEEGQPPERIFLRGGFADVAPGKLTVLAEQAIPVADLDRAQLEQHIQNAREDIEDAKDDAALHKAQLMLTQLTELLEAL